jgi:2,4-dienoyl-CoA reductase-like NADH-dependent reductase (Old Yellow Enzyme family)/thioredoxin reductase
MSPNTWKLLEPTTLGNVNLKNRMVMSPMLTCMATDDNLVSPQMLAYYEARARGGIGAIISEYTYIDTLASKARGHQLGSHGEQCMPGLRRLAETIRRHGTQPILQLCHAGRQSSVKYTGLQPVAPSAIANLGEMPREIGKEEIKQVERAFAAAAERAKRAGFSGIEIHGANGYLLTQFLSPSTNHRKDEYGGTLENRARFSLSTVRQVRELVGEDFVVGYRMNGSDYVDDGITLEDAVLFARMLEQAGVDYLHVSAGMQESWHYVVQPMYLPDACLVHLAQAVKSSVGIPVISVGAHTVNTAEQALREGKADLIAFGRSLIADPDLPQKLLDGKADDVRPCIRGNEGCVSNTIIDHSIRCEVNPAAGREREFVIKPADEKKNVLVVGGGISGLEAARIAAFRGHKVTLLERTRQLGGHLIEGCVPRFKDPVKRMLNWSIDQTIGQGVDIRLNTEGTPESIRAYEPDVLVVAVGSDFIVPEVEGVDQPFVLLPDAAFLVPTEIGRRVVVVGGGTVGCELALYLREEHGRETSVVEQEDQLIPGAGLINRIAIMDRLEKAGVRQYTGCRLTGVHPSAVVCAKNGGTVQQIEADTVVLALGVRAREKTAEQLSGLAETVEIIGDCSEARDIYHSIEDAWRAAIAF